LNKHWLVNILSLSLSLSLSLLLRIFASSKDLSWIFLLHIAYSIFREFFIVCTHGNCLVHIVWIERYYLFIWLPFQFLIAISILFDPIHSFYVFQLYANCVILNLELIWFKFFNELKLVKSLTTLGNFESYLKISKPKILGASNWCGIYDKYGGVAEDKVCTRKHVLGYLQQDKGHYFKLTIHVSNYSLCQIPSYYLMKFCNRCKVMWIFGINH